MKLIIWVLIALALAIGFGVAAQHDPGFVAVSAFGYDIKMPFALFVLALLFGFAFLYLAFNLLVSLFRAPKKFGAWREVKKEESAQQHTMKGFAGLVEGDWSGAEISLLTKVEHNNAALMNYLGAAYAAQQQGQLARRDQHLDAALKEHPKQELAIKITRARMLMQAGELQDARDQLEYLRLKSPKNIAVARLLADVYQGRGDWPELVQLMPVLTKLGALPEEELKQREALALEHHLEAPALLQGDGSKMDDTFKALPRKKRKDAVAIASYARQLMRANETAKAEQVLRKALNSDWNSDLVRLYGTTETGISDQIKTLQNWGKTHADDIELQFALARAFRRNGQLDKAKELLAQVVKATGDSEAIAEMGAVLEELGEHESALLTYKQGMKSLAGTHKPADVVTSPQTQLVALDAGDVETTAVVPVVS